MTHIVVTARRSDWERAIKAGTYKQSTIESTLDEVGFIHASFPDQVMAMAERKYAHQADLVLLLVDPRRVISQIKYEAARSGRPGTFPHIYGPLNPDAVYAALPLETADDGTYITPAALNEAPPDEIVIVKAVVLNAAGQALTVLRGATAPRRPLTWDLPGGFVDAGEQLEAALRREVFEETGIQVGNVTFVEEEAFMTDKGMMIRRQAYAASAREYDVHLSFEHDDYRWVSADQLAELDMPDRFKSAIRIALEAV